jgi:O-antigen ligase
MLTMVVSLGYCAALVFPQRRLTWGLAICFLALAIDGVLGFPLLAKFGRIEEGRIAMWLAAWAMFCDAPILGHGPHTFVLLYKLYLQRLSLPAWLPVDTRVVPWAHNLYFEILAEQGIVGLAAFGFLLVRGLGAAWRLQRAPPTERRIFAAGALAGLCGFCLAAAVELSLLRQWAVIVFFSLLGVIAQLLSSYSPEPVLEKEE